MQGAGPGLVRGERRRLARIARQVMGWGSGAALAAVLASCGTTPYSAPASGVGCAVTVLIPSSGTTLLGTVTATVAGHLYRLTHNSNTIQVGCGDQARLSASASEPAAHPFTEWVLPGKVSSARVLRVTVDGALTVRPGFLVPKQPTATPTPSPSAKASPSPTPATVTLDQWVAYDSLTKTVTWKLVAGYKGVNHGLSFDGEADGAMKVTVPAGWSVTVDFSNVGTTNHSAVIVTSSGTTPVFSGAETPSPMQGTAPGQTASFTFSASTVGGYRLACLMPGHEAAGMWETFTVKSGGLPTASL